MMNGRPIIEAHHIVNGPDAGVVVFKFQERERGSVEVRRLDFETPVVTVRDIVDAKDIEVIIEAMIAYYDAR